MKKILSVLLITILTVTVYAQQKEKQEAEKFEIKPALLVIDIQNEYMKYMDDDNKTTAIETVNGAIAYFRHFEFPVIKISHTDPNWGPPQDSEGFKFIDEIQMKDDDPMFVKNFGNAFKKTELDKYLKENDINTLFLCGLSATGCVLATYHGADDLDYKVFMIKGSLLSPNSDHTEMIQDISETVGWGALGMLLEAAK